MKQAAWQIIAGLAVGLLMAMALNQVLIHAIAGYPTANYPALVFLGAAAFLGGISLIAILIPALRSTEPSRWSP